MNIIRKAVKHDLEAINELASAYKHELGWFRLVTMAEAIRQHEILIVEVDRELVSFIHYHHRQDAQTTVYHIVVSITNQRKGLGRALIDALVKEAKLLGKKKIELRCPEDLIANEFYARLGFKRQRLEPNKRCALIVWRLELV